MEGRLKTVTSVCLEAAKKRGLLGTEGGNIYQLSLWNLSLEQEIIYQDQVIKDVPDTYKVNPGAVEAILEHPTDTNKLLVGYTRGLVVLWDKGRQSAVREFVSQQQLESLSWLGDDKFVSAHNDGSYVVWDVHTGGEDEPPCTPYGPYPCKSILKFYGRLHGERTWKIFSGGMPRASYGDKYTVTVQAEGGENEEDDNHVVFDLSSKVVDFAVVEAEDGQPDSLIILSEEELVAVDLKVADWPQYEVPYLHSIHASAITCIAQATDVEAALVEDIAKYRSVRQAVTANPWPVNGGEVANPTRPHQHHLLVTGHEDGTVRFWGVSGTIMTPLSTFKTSKFFKVDDLTMTRSGLTRRTRMNGRLSARSASSTRTATTPGWR